MAKSRPRDFVVEVTNEDIDRATRSHSGKCMIAQALRRARPDLGNVMVDIQTIRYTDKARGERVVHLTPSDAQDLIVAFDAGELTRMEPVDFKLRRRTAHRINRSRPKTAEDAAKKANGEKGVKYERDTPAEQGKTVARGAAPPRSRSTTHRSYGRRALAVNQARARQGDLPPEPEPVPDVE